MQTKFIEKLKIHHLDATYTKWFNQSASHPMRQSSKLLIEMLSNGTADCNKQTSKIAQKYNLIWEIVIS